MNLLALLPAALALRETKALKDGISRPSFEPRWWYSKSKLDARPVIWSMDNHPEEWEAYSIWDSGKEPITHRRDWYQLGYMLHVPSKHRFRVERGSTAYLASAPSMDDRDLEQCGCVAASRGGRLQRFHSMALKEATSRWFDKTFPAPVLNHEHFKSHFSPRRLRK